jgi:hypothetical protein
MCIFLIKHYSRADHPDKTAHVGAAILIKSSILYTELQIINKPYLQAANISINFNNCISITISSLYFPPPKRNNFVSYQSQQMSEPKLQSFFQKLGSSFIIGGDFNSKHINWGSRYTNTRGRILHNSIFKNNITFISPDTPTYWPPQANRLPDVLDFFLTKIPRHLNTHIKNLNELSSDHTPVLLTCEAVPELNTRQTLSSGPTNWDQFQHNLDKQISLNIPLKIHAQINNAVNQLTTVIQNSISSSSSSVTPNPSNQKKKLNTLPIYIIELIKAKRRARATWQNSRYPIDKIVFNQLTNTLKTELSKHRSTKFESHLQSLTPSDGSIWRNTKTLINQRDTIPPLVCPNNELATSDIEKANTFGIQLSETFTPHPPILINSNHENTVHSFLYAPTYQPTTYQT